MRKEEFTKGNYVHVYNRGSRRMPIVCDAKDRWHFLQMLYYFNTNFTPPNPLLKSVESSLQQVQFQL